MTLRPRSAHRRAWRQGGATVTVAALLLATLTAPAQAQAPLSFLTGQGDKADAVVPLTWGLLIISIAVVVVITVLAVAGVWLRRADAGASIRSVPIARGGGGLRWISIGLGLSSVVFAATLV